jgi:hypothetical protein
MSDTTTMHPDLARRLGIISDVPGGQDAPEPSTMLDWSLHWAARGFFVFPAERHLGTPYVDDWHSQATTEPGRIVKWFSQTADDRRDFYNADIGSAPDRSGHFVVSAHHDEGGLVSLEDIEANYDPLPAELDYFDRWGSRFIWLKGRAYTSHHKLGRGLHVLGAGHFVFLPPSYTPHRNFERE